MKNTSMYASLIFTAFCLFFIILFAYKTVWAESLDLSVLHAVFSIRNDVLTPLMIVMSDIGSWRMTAPLWFVLIITMLYKRQVTAAVFLTVVYFGSRALNWLLKELFHRPRPELDQLVSASHYSFPSGHAMNSMAFFGFLALLSNLYFREKLVLKNAFLLVLTVLIMLIGFSRIYLGVHYFTDVIAGYAMGFAWMMGAGLVYQFISNQKNRIESAEKGL